VSRIHIFLFERKCSSLPMIYQRFFCCCLFCFSFSFLKRPTSYGSLCFSRLLEALFKGDIPVLCTYMCVHVVAAKSPTLLHMSQLNGSIEMQKAPAWGADLRKGRKRRTGKKTRFFFMTHFTKKKERERFDGNRVFFSCRVTAALCFFFFLCVC
jgi:hypothetical protein